MTRIHVLIILLTVFIAHGAGVLNGFTWDDTYLIPKARAASITDAFLDRNTGTAQSDTSYYRPLRTLLFSAVLSVPGPHAFYLHLASVLLHFSVCLILFKTCLALSFSERTSLFCAVLFAVHPLTTEAVAGIANVKELLSTFFALSAVFLMLKSGLDGR